jgi:hypothetical protein
MAKILGHGQPPFFCVPQIWIFEKDGSSIIKRIYTVSIIKHHQASSSIIKHHHQASSSSIIIKHHHQASSSSIIIKHHHQASSSSIIIKHHRKHHRKHQASLSTLNRLPIKIQYTIMSSTTVTFGELTIHEHAL